MERTKRKRDYWVDYVKGFACLLVVLGHFFQSMVKASIISDSMLYNWFNHTVYTFHVALFFVCSGYLYQKYTRIHSFVEWKTHVLKKMLNLGIPYFVFSLLTWILKNGFASEVNSQTYGLVKNLLVVPLAPYWYLYCLFFFFLTIPTVQKQRFLLLILGGALLLKGLSATTRGTEIYPFYMYATNLIWFATGMTVAFYRLNEKIRSMQPVWSILLLATASIFSVFLYDKNCWQLDFMMGALYVVAIISLFIHFEKRLNEWKLLQWFAGYTMPIFLMHTLFAAPFRSALLTLGIRSVLVHLPLGIVISIVGPIATAWLMQKIGYVDGIIFPDRYMNIKR